MYLFTLCFCVIFAGDLKVCTYCSKIVLTYLKSLEINSDLKSDLQALQDDLSSKLLSKTDDSNILVQELASPQRKISVGYQEERLLSQQKDFLSNSDRKNILQQSNSLKVFYEDMSKELPNQNRGSDIVTHLITKNKSSNKSQAMAILTAMLEAGYIVEIDATGMSVKSIRASSSHGIANSSSDTDYFHEFNENSHYTLLRSNEIISNSSKFQLNLDMDCVQRPNANLTGEQFLV